MTDDQPDAFHRALRYTAFGGTQGAVEHIGRRGCCGHPAVP